MSQPLISHRCPQCGAASKPDQLFCAQCGNALGAKTREQTAEPAGPLADSKQPEVRVAEPPPEAAAPEGPIASGAQVAEQGRGAQGQPASVASAAAAPKATPGVHPGLASLRVGLAARRGIADRAQPKAEKQRRVSSVVLDEAAYDSSLRFILVVVVLFVLFLVLLALNKWIV